MSLIKDVIETFREKKEDKKNLIPLYKKYGENKESIISSYKKICELSKKIPIPIKFKNLKGEIKDRKLLIIKERFVDDGLYKLLSENFKIEFDKKYVGYIRRMIEDEGRELESIENWFGKKFMNEVKNII